MSLLRIRGLDRPAAPHERGASSAARCNLGAMSLLEIRGVDRRNTPTDLVPVGEAATGPARHAGVLGRMSLPEIRGLDRPRSAGRTHWHVHREV